MNLNTKIDNRPIMKKENIGIRFTPDEKKEIEDHCVRVGLSVSSFIRYCIFKEMRK